MYLYISYLSKVTKLQCIKGSVLVFQTWMPKESFSRHLKCSAWSPALISSHMKEKEPTFSLANKMGKGNTSFCLVLLCKISWELIPFDFSTLKVCCQQRKKGHQKNKLSYILRQTACKQLLPLLTYLEDELWRWIPASEFSSTTSTFPSRLIFPFDEDLHVYPLTYQECECE